MATTLVWFERDLRLADHPALYAACQDGAAVPVYIWAPDEHGEWAPGAASRWWLHHALDELGQALEEAGSRLILREGPSLDALLDLAETAEADQVVWHERHEPALAARDATIREALEGAGLRVLTLRARMLHDPEAVQTTSKGPYHVFTPFWRKLQAELTVGDPVGVPDLADAAPDGWPGRVPLDELGLDPGHAWTQGLADAWEVREAAGLQVLSTFLDERVEAYPEDRDVPATQGTSRLSPYLAHGHVSPRQAWHAAQSRMEDPQTRESAQAFLRQLAWREFAYHLLHHYPETTHEPLKEKFQAFPWRKDPEHLEAWQRGNTGYPLVDAGMRELWETGWMHNRVRMVVASFLTKDLMLAWQEGAAWFWDTLVDADLANNTLGWQWAAGCGADAQPFFRIFNPVKQGERWDPEGTYTRRYVPALADLPDEALHAPWEHPEALADAGIALGEDYPERVVDHGEARERALEAYELVK